MPKPPFRLTILAASIKHALANWRHFAPRSKL